MITFYVYSIYFVEKFVYFSKILFLILPNFLLIIKKLINLFIKFILI